jgi:hypothetical protein
LKRLALLLALACAACATGGGRQADGGPRLRPSADPSAVIAAEIGFSQLAQTKGQWTAFRETAAAGAEMFVPERVKAADWLKGRADPTVPVKWQPADVWSSCDGSIAVTRGAWQRPGSAGNYVTVWKRQKDGKYKWLLDMSLADEAAPASPDTVNATVADCPRGKRESLPSAAATDTPEARSGKSDDGTLGWLARSSGEGTRSFTLWLGKDGAMREMLNARLGSRGGS